MSDAPSSPGNPSIIGRDATHESIQQDSIEIVVPLRTAHAATLRVIVSSLGSDHGLSVDEIDDLKLAVSEVFTVLVDDAETARTSGSAPAPRARVRYSAGDDGITVELDGGEAGGDIELDALATTILSSVVDEHRISRRAVTLIKRRDETAERGGETLR